jgi:predicted P-loop ATPase
MLVLEGLQGKGKTSSVRALFGAQWYAETMESPSGKDFYQALKGRWGVEIGEMDSFSKADVTKVKSAITSRFDTYRPSYGRNTRSFRRECVFIGTTNESEYLRDATGGRRFLPVRITRVDIEGMLAQRDQLWAEAAALYREGFRWWDLPAEAVEEQEARFVQDAWEEVIGPWVEGKLDHEKAYPPRLRPGLPRIEWVTTTELLEYALGVEIAKQGRQEQMRIAPIMRRLGWEHDRTMTAGKRQRRWVRAGSEDDDAVPF